MTTFIDLNWQARCRSFIGLLIGLALVQMAVPLAAAQTAEASEFTGLQSRVIELETRVSRAEQMISKSKEAVLVLFLFGAFCALWAQNTGRSAWGWFFLGLLFSVITVAVLLSKNAGDQARSRSAGRGKTDLDDRLLEACLDRPSKEKS